MGSDFVESFMGKLVRGNDYVISVFPDSKEEADRIFNALSAGGVVEMPMDDHPWGRL
jgi:PhnB protein